MTDRNEALRITQALLIALQAYESIGGDTGKLLMLRAQAEGGVIAPEALDALLDESQAALDDLQAALEKPE
jgi:hypothetical protein